MALGEREPFLNKLPYRKLVFLFLAAATLGVYWQVQYHDFINYDDPAYVTSNRHVQTGLTISGISWALTTMDLSNWHPLTWLSHMADYHIFGLNPAGHHWTNLLFHLLNVILLFYIFNRFTGDMWKSTMVAALFAIHPLNVESVAWVSERKNVLSTFFWMLTILAYGYYAFNPHWKRYVVVLVAFTLGLMAKPMLVTLPFVLLLFDWWPLRRTRFSLCDGDMQNPAGRWISPGEGKTSVNRLLLEKIPLFILTIFSIIMTLKAASGQAIAAVEVLPMLSRIENAIISYVFYIGKMLWPEKLSIFYPYPPIRPLWQVFGAALLLAGITAAVIRKLKPYPYMAVGWFWYVGTLIPVIGLVQVGMQAMADRYMYVPMIGIFIMIAWGISDFFRSWSGRKMMLAVSSGVVLCLLMVCTFLQVQHWQNSVHLFRHAVSVTSGNFIAYNLLGNALRDTGQFEEAMTNYRQAIRVNPEFWPAYNNSGVALAAQGKYDDAIRSYSSAIVLSRKAMAMSRDVAWIRFNLGDALMQTGSIDEAAFQFRQAGRLRPEVAVFHNGLGVALIRQGRYDEAVKEFRETIQLDPDHAGAHHNLAMVLSHQGNLQEAVVHFSEALRIQPDYGEARRNLQEVLKKMTNPRMTDE
ncbi:MAG: tetratricopeptide repeat protein [Deltaproteobacteria bacterium]|nr:tetratricopeptide repeat protein [Deltaproteobacteria bacterium]